MPKLILIVDDDPRLSRLFKRLLDRWGYQTRLAKNSSEAQAALKAGGISAVLLDLVLGSESGWIFLQCLRQSSNIPVLFMTGADVDDDVRRDAALMGAQGIIQKPFNQESLRTALTRLLGEELST